MIGLLVYVVKGKAKPTAAASERGFGKYGKSIAGDVESPSLLLLLLLLPPPPPPPLCCCCCPIIDGSDFWASEMTENSRNMG